MRRLHGVLGLTIAASLAAGAAQIPRITRIEFSPAREAEGGGMLITLVGTGQCTYTLDYGDEKTERRTATLPGKVSHRYAADGDFLYRHARAAVRGRRPGEARYPARREGHMEGRRRHGPTPALEVVATIEGRGACRHRRLRRWDVRSSTAGSRDDPCTTRRPGLRARATAASPCGATCGRSSTSADGRAATRAALGSRSTLNSLTGLIVVRYVRFR